MRFIYAVEHRLGDISRELKFFFERCGGNVFSVFQLILLFKAAGDADKSIVTAAAHIAWAARPLAFDLDDELVGGFFQDLVVGHDVGYNIHAIDVLAVRSSTSSLCTESIS